MTSCVVLPTTLRLGLLRSSGLSTQARNGRRLLWKKPSNSVKVLSTAASSRCFATSSKFPPIDDGAGQPGLYSSSSSMTGHGGVHDVGGLDSLLGQPLDLSDPSLQDWEQETHALLIVLVQKKFMTTDELRRNIEAMASDHYIARSYYCKWATSIALGLIERGVITYSQLDEQLLGSANTSSSSTAMASSDATPKFTEGQRVRVHSEQLMARWRKPHLRVPGYIFGVSGTVESYEGSYPDPSYKAFRSMLLKQGATGEGRPEEAEEKERNEHLYRVRFLQDDIWPEGKGLSLSDSHSHGHGNGNDNTATADTVAVEIYENWLGDNSAGSLLAQEESGWEMDPTSALQKSSSSQDAHSHSRHNHTDDHHDHDHDHDHEHLPRVELEQKAVDLELASRFCSSGSVESDTQPTDIVGDRLGPALIALLSQPDQLGPGLRMDLRKIIDAMESLSVRADGVNLVVKAWMDPAFEQRLLEDAASAALEMGIQTANATTHTKLKVVKSELPTADQPGVHNLITCTLCSCYPLSMLGLSPKWYKSRSYRARAVREPRAMLRDSFGLDLSPSEWTVRVHDSTADLRYIVLPVRPPNTEGWTEEQLRGLITRDTMIGVALPEVVQSQD